MSLNQRPTHETVCHECQRAVDRLTHLLDSFPHRVDSLVERRPALSGPRLEIPVEQLLANLCIRPAAQLTKISLTQPLVDCQRRVGHVADQLSRHPGAQVVGRHDMHDPVPVQPRGEARRLPPAQAAERRVGKLDDARRVERGLGVTNEKDRLHRGRMPAAFYVRIVLP